LTGKAALIRRGGCEFGTKALRAEWAGASAAIIINHYNNPLDKGCTPLGSSGTDDPLISIPSFLLCRNVGEQIEAALKAGGPVELCVTRASLRCPTAEHSYAIPSSQAAPMDLISVLYKNRTAQPQAGVLCKVDIISPAGKLTTLIVDAGNVEAEEEVLVRFPTYDAPAIMGKFRAVYSNNQFTETFDTLVREFMHTQGTYATDNLKPTGSIGPSSQQFSDAGRKYQTAGMVITGPKGFAPKYASFGLGNASAVAVGDPAVDVVSVVLYDNDVDENGQADLGATFGNLLPVAFADYQFSNENANEIICAELTSLEGLPQIELKANHLYLISILYDGNLADQNTSLTFTCSDKVFYPNFANTGFHTPLALDQIHDGWDTATVVTRLREGLLEWGAWEISCVLTSTKNLRLSEAKYTIMPNPANNVVRLNLQLGSVNKSVAATLIDFQGRAVDTQVVRDFQNGQLTFDATEMPSGAYMIWIRTSDEGSTMAKLMICH
jgi:hypothetical protein